jgi:hypothetical protein
MTPSDLSELYTRELDNLHKEISAYTDESKLWAIKGDVKNSPGNLCLHLLGNINHFIGAVLGKNGYVRKRDEEFTVKNIPKQQLLDMISETKNVVGTVFSSVDKSELDKDFPAEIFGKRNTEYMLSYFYGHLMYHLGQISYHRRLV